MVTVWAVPSVTKLSEPSAAQFWFHCRGWSRTSQIPGRKPIGICHRPLVIAVVQTLLLQWIGQIYRHFHWLLHQPVHH